MISEPRSAHIFGAIYAKMGKAAALVMRGPAKKALNTSTLNRYNAIGMPHDTI